MHDSADRALPPRAWSLAIVSTLALAALGAAGYLLYLHAGDWLARAHTLPAGWLLGLAVVGGAASFFSPCSIAITPAFLAYIAQSPPSASSGQGGKRNLTAAAQVALGIVLFYLLAGAVIGLLGNAVYNVMIYFIPVVGALFVALGVVLFTGRAGWLARIGQWNPFNRIYDRTETGAGTRGGASMVGFGVAYGAASHTCSLPIFLGVLMVPLIVGNYPLAVASVLAYGIAMAVLVVVMMALGQRVFGFLRRLGPWLMRLTALLFIGTGVFLFYYFAQSDGLVQAGPSGVERSPAKVVMASSVPMLHLLEGSTATGYPYRPRTLRIPAGRPVNVAITDHVGGCLLRTVFVGLGPSGTDASISVPVGHTRTVTLYAPRAGRYAFHCGGNMYSGTVQAQ